MASSSLHLRIALAVLMLFVVTIQAQKKTEYADMAAACYAKDKTISEGNDCFRDVWDIIRPVLVKGDPELNIKPLDPIEINDFQLDDKGSVVTVNASFSKIIVVGGKDFKAISVNYDKAKQTVTNVVEIPELYLTGRYAVKGEILVLPLNGEGPFYLNLTGIQGTLVAHLTRKGPHKTISKLDVNFTIKDMKLDLSGLLGADSTVSESVKKMLNDNGQQILADFQGKAKEVVSNALKSFVEVAVLKLPD